MSLKGDKYETTEEVKFRLENTVVTYDGKPVYISRVSMPDPEDDGKEVARVFFYDLPLLGAVAGAGKNRETRKFLSSKKFNIAPFKMGYMNHNGQAFFVSRTPVRQNKQGLSAASTVITDVKNRRTDHLNFNAMLRSQGFVDMINSTYPDFKQAGDLLGDKEISSVAISHSFSFTVDHDLEALLLLHKGVKCGLAMRGDRTVKISPKFLFLRQEMEAHRIPIS